ncbi:hypothetical protein [Lactobacillus johnsonii]|uniref:Uncharacterized protein n=1 Tax=Lactobacillus johnsonii (strain FI9785) TaxID=633699 RepID=D0R3N1_LACJF|nr:hypothetical protein [Lactobacillus johnsonii]CAX66694.1 hypothetical protein predicted by Glimmer/Critica [Lactobacillus johnsonii FI9785]
MKINVYTPNFHRITDNYLLDELRKYNSKEKVVFRPNWKSGYKYQIEVKKASELHDFIHNFYAYGKNPKILADDDGEWYIEMKY